MKKNEKIRMENVCFSHKDQKILENITVSFPENSIVAVTGPSGTGKSTFLSLFNRLWETFGEGRLHGKLLIRFGGRMVDIYGDRLSVAQLRRRVGMVFQSPNPLQ
jgi:phosphate transport system ATP-binding protein